MVVWSGCDPGMSRGGGVDKDWMQFDVYLENPGLEEAPRENKFVGDISLFGRED